MTDSLSFSELGPGDVGPRFESQARFLACPADFSLFGGAMGGGKTAGLCLDALHSVHVPGYAGVLMRRKAKDHGQAGGLLSEARKLWVPTGARFRMSPTKEAIWPSGASIQFQFPEMAADSYEEQFQGLQVAWSGFDEMTHFTWPVVSYVWGRTRNTVGLHGYMRGSCNPDPDHFLRQMVDWYLDDEGYADRAKGGALSYWATHSETDEIIMGPTRAEVRRRARRADEFVWSFAFHPSLASENVVLMASDPHYVARASTTKLRAERFGLGNWNTKAGGGAWSESHWGRVMPADVPRLRLRVRCWDRAATRPNERNRDPDFSASTLCGFKEGCNDFYAGLGDHGVTAMREEPGKVWDHIQRQAIEDGPSVVQRIPIDPGAAGKEATAALLQRLKDPRIGPIDAWPMANASGKVTRAEPLSDALEAGNAYVVTGSWYTRPYKDPGVNTTLGRLFWAHHDPFPDGGRSDHDDLVDCTAGAYLYGHRRQTYKGIGRKGWESGSTRDAWRGR